MKPNNFTTCLSAIKRWGSATLLCMLAIALIWQGALPSSAAMPYSDASLIASADASSQVQGKARKDAERTKNFVQDTKDAVQKTARKNADRVERATGNNGDFIERKANRDAARIQQRAERDAARTQEAVDDTKNVIERAVDGIKNTFSN